MRVIAGLRYLSKGSASFLIVKHGRPLSTRTILHVIESRGPGGAETVLRELVVRTSRPAQRALAIIPADSGWLERVLPRETQRHVQPTPPARSGPLDIAYIRGLRRVMAAEHPALIHAHSFDTALYASLAAMGSSIPIVATFHGASDVQRRGFRNRLKWAAVAQANALVCVSESLAQLARATPGVPTRAVRAILNGVDLAPFTGITNAALRTQLQLAAETRLIGALGNVRGPKGYPILLEAFAALRTRGLDAHLVIAGDDKGALGDELRGQRRALGLEPHMTFLGFIDAPAPYLEGLDIFVLSSLSEGFSLSTVQAMVAARPIVATRSGGPQELIAHDVTGTLVQAGSAEALTDELWRLAHEPALAARIGAAARARALGTFSIEGMVSAYEALYEELAPS